MLDRHFFLFRYILHLGHLHIATGGHRNCGHKGNRRKDQSAAGLQYSNAGSVRFLPSCSCGVCAFQGDAQRAAYLHATSAVRWGFRLEYELPLIIIPDWCSSQVCVYIIVSSNSLFLSWMTESYFLLFISIDVTIDELLAIHVSLKTSDEARLVFSKAK